ncbi:MAG: FeoA family protein [Turicibacter sp.]
MSLASLKKGEVATLLDYKNISTQFANRLFDVGIGIGSEVTILNKLNFGQLLHISIDQVEFCIRTKDAKNLMVQV